MEVKNLTCDPQQAGADLRTDLHEHLAPPPQRVRLNEAAASHSHALVRPPPARPPGPRAASLPRPPSACTQAGWEGLPHRALLPCAGRCCVARLPSLPRACAGREVAAGLAPGCG